MINQNYIIPILCIIILIIILLNRKQITKYIDTLKKKYKYKYLDSLLSSNITYYHLLIAIILILIFIILTLIFINWDLLKSFLNTNTNSYTIKNSTTWYKGFPGTYESNPTTITTDKLNETDYKYFQNSNGMWYKKGISSLQGYWTYSDEPINNKDDYSFGGKLI